MNQQDASDIILKFCADNNNRFELYGDKEKRLIKNDHIVFSTAFDSLCSVVPPLMTKASNNPFIGNITNDGIDFIYKLGYAGKKVEELLEKEEKESEKTLAFMLFESTKNLNEASLRFISFQKKMMWTTLFLSGCFLLVALADFIITLRENVDPSQNNSKKTILQFQSHKAILSKDTLKNYKIQIEKQGDSSSKIVQ